MFLLIFILPAINCKQTSEISIVPLSMFNYTDTIMDRGKLIISKGEYFLVKEYTDNMKNESLIDSFAHKNTAVGISNYANYSMLFYKESGQTNIKHLKEHPKDIDRYSRDHDWIYEYSWLYEKFIGKKRLKREKLLIRKLRLN